MGSYNSKQTNILKKGVFGNDLIHIEKIINEILTHNGEFRNSNYNFLNTDTCNKYTMVAESRLSKHLKIHLHDLKESIYFIKKNNDDIPLKNEKITKSEICVLISEHFKKTLKILSLIREIYDIENGGDFSIAGIIYRNLVDNNGVYEISYCALPQEPLYTRNNDKFSDHIDFKNLKGLNTFVNNFLTEDEANTFVSHLRELFGNCNNKKIANIICNDTIVGLKQYKRIYENIHIDCNKTGGGLQTSKKLNNDLLIKVGKNKPIISYELCFDKQKLKITNNDKLKRLFDKFKSDYKQNIEVIHSCIDKLIYYDK